MMMTTAEINEKQEDGQRQFFSVEDLPAEVFSDVLMSLNSMEQLLNIRLLSIRLQSYIDEWHAEELCEEVIRLNYGGRLQNRIGGEEKDVHAGKCKYYSAASSKQEVDTASDWGFSIPKQVVKGGEVTFPLQLWFPLRLKDQVTSRFFRFLELTEKDSYLLRSIFLSPAANETFYRAGTTMIIDKKEENVVDCHGGGSFDLCSKAMNLTPQGLSALGAESFIFNAEVISRIDFSGLTAPCLQYLSIHDSTSDYAIVATYKGFNALWRLLSNWNGLVATPTLKGLILSGNVRNTALENLSLLSPSLTALMLNGCLNLTEKFAVLTLSTLENLTALYLTGCQNLYNANTMKSIAPLCFLKLETLNISSCLLGNEELKYLARPSSAPSSSSSSLRYVTFCRVSIHQ